MPDGNSLCFRWPVGNLGLSTTSISILNLLLMTSNFLFMKYLHSLLHTIGLAQYYKFSSLFVPVINLCSQKGYDHPAIDKHISTSRFAFSQVMSPRWESNDEMCLLWGSYCHWQKKDHRTHCDWNSLVWT